MEGTPFRRLAEVGTILDTLYASCAIELPNVRVSINPAAVHPETERLSQAAYAARIARPGAIQLVRLPARTVLHADAHFALTAAAVLVAEQVHPIYFNDPGPLLALTAGASATLHVEEEAFLVARFGEGTWGHWLGELLPKVAIAERFFRGRFRYVMPGWVLSEETAGVFARRVLESLAAYGVGADRLIRVAHGCRAVFHRLHALTPVWTDHVLHPQALDLMQHIGGTEAPRAGRAVALLRRDNNRRDIANQDEVCACLARHGFELADTASLPFLEQVSLFRDASLVFSTLGSSLAGLIYAPRQVHVLAVAPAIFADRFFFALMQLKDAAYAEVRGPVVAADAAIPRDSRFSVAVADIETALARLQGGRA